MAMAMGTMATDLKLKAGQQFRYAGLGHGVEDADRTITIHSVTVAGEVTFQIELDVEQKDMGPMLHNVPIERIPWLIANRIWFPMEGDGG